MTYPALEPEEQAWIHAGFHASDSELAEHRDRLAAAPDDPKLRTIVRPRGPRARDAGTSSSTSSSGSSSGGRALAP